MNIITISREFGSGGREVGKRLADALGYGYYDREILTAMAQSTEMEESYLEQILERGAATPQYPDPNRSRLWRCQCAPQLPAQKPRCLAGYPTPPGIGKTPRHLQERQIPFLRYNRSERDSHTPARMSLRRMWRD